MVQVTELSQAEGDGVEQTLLLLAADFDEQARRQLDAMGKRLLAASLSVQKHSVGVAGILDSLGLDADSVATGLLDQLVAEELIDLQQTPLPETVKVMLAGVARLRLMGSEAGPQAQAENLRRMLLALSDDVRVVLVALAERLQTMRELKFQPEALRKPIAEETLHIFAPLANRLGIGQMKWEMEDLSFRFVKPKLYSEIAHLLAEKRVDRERYIEDVVATIVSELKDAGVEAEVYGRPKHIYSIWKKMQGKGLGFHELYDVRAVRIMVKDLAECYAALGLVHALWQPIPKEFDDYIAKPKHNNYQSLHTAVVGPEGQVIEVQIRTQEMHEHAELGVAAHWRYKEGGQSDPAFDRKVNRLRQLLDSDEAQDDDVLMESFQSDETDARIYVMSPAGKVVDLVKDATPVDFAYAIHTEVGHRCRGAKVNGKIVPLTYALQNGETVEILTTKEGAPSRDWLSNHSGYVKSSRARYRIRQWLKQQDVKLHAADGKVVVDRELRRMGVNADVDLKKFLRRLRQDSIESLYAEVGRGDIGLGHLNNAISETLLEPEQEDEDEIQISKKETKLRRRGDIDVDGVGDLLTRIAACCKPVPGDDIIGYITKGTGVAIHRRDCSNVLSMEGEDCKRLIEVSWHSGMDHQEDVYLADIVVDAYDRTGLLKDITLTLADAKINVIAVNTVSDKQHHTARLVLTVEIRNGAQLGRVLHRIGQLPNVSEVCRK